MTSASARRVISWSPADGAEMLSRLAMNRVGRASRGLQGAAVLTWRVPRAVSLMPGLCRCLVGSDRGAVDTDLFCQCGEGVVYGGWLFDPGEVASFSDNAPDCVRGLEALGLPQRLGHDAVG